MRDFVEIESRQPPASTSGVLGWIRKNLLATPVDALLTVIGVYLVYKFLPPLWDWFFWSANFAGDSNDSCTQDGACWVFVKQRMSLFMYGFYPTDEYWRLNTVFALLAATFIPQFFSAFPYKKALGIFALTGFPVISFFLISGEVFGLEHVETEQWGGLSLTLIIAFVGIVAALPFGILLALGRQSNMPIIRTMCVVFIELWRGVPLISVLFMASVMLPLFLPDGVTFNKLLRAMIGIVMFQSAYMAEVIRGGLQAIPKGQYEAAEALGMSYWKSMSLIILPQALKLVIPGVVNTFIALFKDTTLVLIIGLFDVLGSVQSAIVDPDWRGVAIEGYVFAALCFWVFCFVMSRYSMSLERKLHTGHKR